MSVISPLRLAISHQDEMCRYVEKIRDNSGCIGQLLIGREVKRKRDGVVFTVTEARLGLSGKVALHGKAKGKARHTRHIGSVYDVELIEETSNGQ